MATTREDGERITLSKLDTSILVALLDQPLDGYSIARQCEADSGGVLAISNGTMYPALNRLKVMHFIHSLGKPLPGPGKPRQAYQITPLGREVLSWELGRLQKLVKIASDRTKKPRR